jgi:hypothetical protein
MWVPPAKNVIQFKVTLKYIKPPIWRRLVLSDNYTLGDLHDVIQLAMGWQNCHMRSFRIGGVYYTSKAASEMEDMVGRRLRSRAVRFGRREPAN